MNGRWRLLMASVLLAACSTATDDRVTGSDQAAITSVSGAATTPATAPSSTATVQAGVVRETAMDVGELPYATVSPTQVLDLYLPVSDGKAPVPVVVLLHAGGFYMGDEHGLTSTARLLVGRGYAAVAVRYRLSGEALFPAGAQDVKAAVRWLRAHSAEYGLDSSHLVAWGYSSGGWMAAMLGATGDQDTVFDDPSLGNADQPSSVVAVVSFYGIYDLSTTDIQVAEVEACGGAERIHNDSDSFVANWLGEPALGSELAALGDLTAYVATAETLPAWFLDHGDVDCVAPVGQAHQMQAALEAAGASAIVRIEPGFTHADPRFNEQPLAAALEFLAEVAPVS